MLLNYEDISPVKKAVEVEIPADRIAAVSRTVAAEFGRQAKIPGFRPGKVPPNVVRTRFAKEIEEEVLNRLLPLSFREALQEKDVQPVGDPHLAHIDPLIEGAPLKYRAEFEIRPSFELADYRGLEVSDPKIEVSEQDIEAMIERLREQASAYRVETERGIEDGDFVMVDIGYAGEGVDEKSESGHVRVGEETPLPELHDALRGRKAGDTASFEKSYGEDATNELLRGKNIRHDITVKEVRIQEKPEVTDEFAKSVGNFENVDEMRQAIRVDILRHREQEVLRAKRNQIGERLLALHQFDVPETLVEEELGKSLQNYARYLASQGVDIDKAQLDWERIGNEFRPEAANRARRSLILEEIAKKEKLVVSDVEVDAEIRRAASEHGRDMAEVKHRLKHDGGYEALRLSLSQDKALDFILKEATLQPV
jgi:trigger factor